MLYFNNFNQVYTYLVEYLDTWLLMKVNIILARNISEIFVSFDESVLQLHMKVLLNTFHCITKYAE